MGQFLDQRQSFVVQIISQQNNTLQGTITWVATGKTRSFRSALEMMKLIDSGRQAAKTPESLAQQQAN